MKYLQRRRIFFFFNWMTICILFIIVFPMFVILIMLPGMFLEKNSSRNIVLFIRWGYWIIPHGWSRCYPPLLTFLLTKHLNCYDNVFFFIERFLSLLTHNLLCILILSLLRANQRFCWCLRERKKSGLEKPKQVRLVLTENRMDNF